MTFDGSVITEQGVTFAIVVVKENVINNSHEANETIASFRRVFGSKPIILMAQNYQGRPTYYGRKDIVNFLANVPMEAIPWKQYTIS